MALQKNKDSSFGVTGNYNRITGISIDPKNGNALITVSLYKDKAARDANKLALLNPVYTLKSSVFNIIASKVTTGGTIWAELATALYTYLKTLPDFSESVDV